MARRERDAAKDKVKLTSILSGVTSNTSCREVRLWDIFVADTGLSQYTATEWIRSTARILPYTCNNINSSWLGSLLFLRLLPFPLHGTPRVAGVDTCYLLCFLKWVAGRGARVLCTLVITAAKSGVWKSVPYISAV